LGGIGESDKLSEILDDMGGCPTTPCGACGIRGWSMWKLLDVSFDKLSVVGRDAHSSKASIGEGEKGHINRKKAVGQQLVVLFARLVLTIDRLTLIYISASIYYEPAERPLDMM
jgi:hypothetical protein